VTAYPLTTLITLFSICLFLYMGMRVGLSRNKYGVEAPATSGHPDFDRLFRIHMNTLEGLAMFLPALWIFATFVSDVGAAALGLIWFLGRVTFMIGYSKAAKSRSAGFGIQFLALVILVIGGFYGVISSLL
jgi:glutathione S-transferase